MTYTFNKDQSIMSASRTKFNISRATMCNCCAEMLLLLQETGLAYTVRSIFYENNLQEIQGSYPGVECHSYSKPETVQAPQIYHFSPVYFLGLEVNGDNF